VVGAIEMEDEAMKLGRKVRKENDVEGLEEKMK
jgi:hypothetical protein